MSATFFRYGLRSAVKDAELKWSLDMIWAYSLILHMSNWGLERWSSLPKVMGLIRVISRTGIVEFCLPRYPFFFFFPTTLKFALASFCTYAFSFCLLHAPPPLVTLEDLPHNSHTDLFRLLLLSLRVCMWSSPIGGFLDWWKRRTESAVWSHRWSNHNMEQSTTIRHGRVRKFWALQLDRDVKNLESIQGQHWKQWVE